jgi:DNA-binding LacI/PurR family transcriptional regulator
MWDVAAVAKVSQKTVSRVINDAPNVSPEVRRRVQAAIRELGYRPNPAARALVTHRTHSIGVIAVGTPQFGPAMRVFSLERAARSHGYELALATPEDTSPTHIREALESLLARGVEGIVLEVPTELTIDPDLLAGVPVSSNVGLIAGLDRQVSVGVDQVGAGMLATGYLLDLGHLAVAHIGGPASWQAAGQRRDGWVRAHRERGVTLPISFEGDWSARSGYAAGQRLLAEHPEITAVFVANDQMAMGLLRAAVEADRVVPDSLSVVGMDDVPEAEFQMVPLTTVGSDGLAISERILTELVAMIEGGPPADPVVIPNELVVRRSSGPPPTG